MITIETLLTHGFSRFVDSLKKEKQGTGYVESYQLKVQDEKGAKYFINVDVWDHRKILPHVKELGFEAHTQFNGLSDEKNAFNVQLFIEPSTTIEYLLNFFETIFQQMNCDYYEAY